MRDKLHKSGTAVLSCWMDFTPDGHIQWLCTTGFDIWYNPWQSRKVAFINMTAISFVLWASYQICKIAGCACAGNAGNVSPRRRIQRKLLVTIPACIMARASRTCRDACRDHLPTVAGKTFPAFPAHVHPQFYVSGKRPMETHSRDCWKKQTTPPHNI